MEIQLEGLTKNKFFDIVVELVETSNPRLTYWETLLSLREDNEWDYDILLTLMSPALQNKLEVEGIANGQVKGKRQPTLFI